MQLGEILDRPTDREFDRGERMRTLLASRDASGQTRDAVDIEPALRHHGGDLGDVFGLDLASEQRQDVARLALLTHPALIGIGVDWREADIEPHAVRAEQQLPENAAVAALARQLDQQAQRQGVMDGRLTDIQDRHMEAREDPGQGGGDAGPILARHVDQNDFAHLNSGLEVMETQRRKPGWFQSCALSPEILSRRTQTRPSRFDCFFSVHSPAIVMRSMSQEPVRVLPGKSQSLPTATSPANIFLRLPAMVISSTGYWISPRSTQKPDAPRE